MNEEEFVAFVETVNLSANEEVYLRVKFDLRYDKEKWEEFQSQHQVFKNPTIWAALRKLPDLGAKKKTERPSA